MRDPIKLPDVTCTNETAQALLCIVEGVERWVARSQVLPESQVKRLGDSGELILTEYVAGTEGLADEDRA